MPGHAGSSRARAALDGGYRFLFGGWKRRAFLALVLVAVVAAVAYRSWIGAQARAVVVLSTTIETPLLTWVTTRLTDEPRVVDTVVADMPTVIIQPGSGDGPWPTVVFVNGATQFGRNHPDVRALGRGLARAGHVVVIPDLPGLAEGEITTETLSAAVDVAAETAEARWVEGGSIGLAGVSVGGALALLAAEDPALRDEISAVVAIAPYASLAEVIRLATTGTLRDGQTLVSYDADPFVGVAVARSLAAALPPGPDRATLLAEAHAIDRNSDTPLAWFRSRAADDLGPDGTAAVELLANQDPERFDALYDALPAETRAAVDRLSPASVVAEVDAPIELVTSPRDRYFPQETSRTLAHAAPNANLTVTGTFGHAIPQPSARDPVDLYRFNVFAVRALQALRAP